EISNAGIKPDYKINVQFDWQSDAKLINSIISFQKRLRTLIKMIGCEYILILGDRIEMLAVINLALITGIKIIHISGGEVTEGAIDDHIRKTLSLIADIHFVSGECFADELKRLLKGNSAIFNAGDPILEIIDSEQFKTLEEINKKYNISLINKEYIMFTYHPETNTEIAIEKQFEGIEKFLMKTDFYVLCTAPNIDKGGDFILKKLKRISKRRKNIIFVPHLGFINYISLLRYCKFAMGNSSSLIIETPYLKKPSLLVGRRQFGRPLTKSIIETDYDYKSILESINCIKNMNKDSFNNMELKYERKETSQIIKETLEDLIN
ncbi:UDP-N-acetylglucosamine 2-epimerase (hydrolyzing), partial [candidate division WOR-3 bacterium]|nr:UDP-N-acetylglucosamine 2-epimerase (hydrolyzing) [candidate division WOR-3 bacterium]